MIFHNTINIFIVINITRFSILENKNKICLGSNERILDKFVDAFRIALTKESKLLIKQ